MCGGEGLRPWAAAVGQHADLVSATVLSGPVFFADDQPRSWSMLKYPIPKEKRMALIKIYFHVCTTPGMPNHIIAACSDGLQVLCRSKKKLSVNDMRLPWMPIYKILSKDLFLTRRQFEIR